MIYYACPVGTDPEYVNKKLIVGATFGRLGQAAYFPLEPSSSEGSALESTVEKISSCSAFVADLTYERPSVYYELGVAAGVYKPVYLIASCGTQIHQIGEHVVAYYSDLASFKSAVEIVATKAISAYEDFGKRRLTVR